MPDNRSLIKPSFQYTSHWALRHGMCTKCDTKIKWEVDIKNPLFPEWTGRCQCSDGRFYKGTVAEIFVNVRWERKLS